VVYTTANDFASCVTTNSAIVTNLSGGEVRLAGTIGDAYTATTLDTTRWTAGTWSGGAYTPSLSNGLL
jgi:hypothetical protein